MDEGGLQVKAAEYDFLKMVGGSSNSEEWIGRAIQVNGARDQGTNFEHSGEGDGGSRMHFSFTGEHFQRICAPELESLATFPALC